MRSWEGLHDIMYCMSVHHELPIQPICTSSQSLYIIDTREAETLGRLNRCRMSKKISMNLWTQRARAQVFLFKGPFTITSIERGGEGGPISDQKKGDCVD